MTLNWVKMRLEKKVGNDTSASYTLNFLLTWYAAVWFLALLVFTQQSYSHGAVIILFVICPLTQVSQKPLLQEGQILWEATVSPGILFRNFQFSNFTIFFHVVSSHKTSSRVSRTWGV